MNISIKTTYMGVDQLTPYPQNPRTISSEELSKLCKSIEEDSLYFETRPVICSDRTGLPVIIAGEKRWIAARKLALEQIPVAIIPNLTEAQEKRILIKDNGSFGEWDWGLVKDYGFLDLPMGEWGVDIQECFNTVDDSPKSEVEETRKSLNERFGVPPFSILDTRQGYWQERKRTWLALGIKSEESREEMKSMGSYAGSVPRYYDLKEKAEKRIGRILSNKEFEANFLLEMLPKDSQLAFTESGGMLSIFDPVLCEIAYRWFCPDQGAILDPFAGGSVRGIVAGSLGYSYFGIDLRKEQVESNQKQGEAIIPNANVVWQAGNSVNLDVIFPDLKADLIFSCPPYFDLEVYSDSKEDLSNLEWEEFKKQYAEIIRKSVAQLKEDSFACFVVGDIRDERGFYRDFVGYTTECFEQAGMKLYNEIILVNVAGSLPVRVTKQFNNSRKVGKCHQNVLVYYKGNPKSIKEKFGELDLSEVELEEMAEA